MQQEEIQQLEDAYAQAPQSDTAFKLAQGYMTQQRYTEAFMMCHKCLKLQQAHPQAQLLIVEIYWRQGKQDKAEEALRILKNKHPLWSNAILFEAEKRIEQGQVSQAIALLQTAYQQTAAKDISLALEKLGVTITPTIRIETKPTTQELPVQDIPTTQASDTPVSGLKKTFTIAAIAFCLLAGFAMYYLRHVTIKKQQMALLQEAKNLVQQYTPETLIQAEDKYDQLLQQDKDNSQTLSMIAFINYALVKDYGILERQNTASIALKKASIHLKKENIAHIAAQALAFLTDQKPTQAELLLDHALSTYKEQAILYGLLYETYLRQAKYTQAQTALTQARTLALSQDQRIALLDASELQRTGNFESAKEIYDHILNQTRWHPLALAGRSLCLLGKKQHRIDLAWQDFNTLNQLSGTQQTPSIKQQKKILEALLTLANNQNPKALDSIEQLNENITPGMRFIAAKFLNLANQTNQALLFFKQVEEQAPEFAPVYFYLSEYQEGNLKKQTLNKYITLAPYGIYAKEVKQALNTLEQK